MRTARVAAAAFLALSAAALAQSEGVAEFKGTMSGSPGKSVAREKKDQRVTATMELVRLERKPVPSSLFEIPAGYRETSAMGVMMTPEQEKAMKDALEKMTPEQRKMYEEMMKKQQGKDQ